jgi:hypothetical protein
MGAVFKVRRNTLYHLLETALQIQSRPLLPIEGERDRGASPMHAYNPLENLPMRPRDVRASPAGDPTWFGRPERVPVLPKVVNTFTGAYASILLFFVFPGYADPNVPLTLWHIMERQEDIIRWLNKAEGACSAFVAGMYYQPL